MPNTALIHLRKRVHLPPQFPRPRATVQIEAGRQGHIAFPVAADGAAHARGGGGAVQDKAPQVCRDAAPGEDRKVTGYLRISLPQRAHAAASG